MLEELAYILLFVLAGYALRRVGVLGEEGGRALVSVTLWLFLPALVLRSLWGTTLGELSAALAPIGAGMAATVVVALAWWRLAPRVTEAPRRAGVVALAAAFGNTGFLGFPVVLLLLGEEGLRIAVLYSLGWKVVFFTLGLAMAASFAGEAASPRKMLKGLAAQPPMWATLVGLAMLALGLHPPAEVSGFFDLLAPATTPVIMISVGAFLSFRMDRSYLHPFAAVCAGKFLVLPLLSWAACWLVGANDLQTATVVLQGAMPPAIMLSILTSQFRLDEEFSSNVTFAATLVGVVGLAVGISLAGMGAGG